MGDWVYEYPFLSVIVITCAMMLILVCGAWLYERWEIYRDRIARKRGGVQQDATPSTPPAPRIEKEPRDPTELAEPAAVYARWLRKKLPRQAVTPEFLLACLYNRTSVEDALRQLVARQFNGGEQNGNTNEKLRESDAAGDFIRLGSRSGSTGGAHAGRED